MHEGENRTFGVAVLASVVFHALLLSIFPALRESQSKPSVAPGPIVARLVSPRAAAAPAPLPTEEKREERAAEEPPAPPVAKPLPSPAAKPAPVAKSVSKAKAAPATSSAEQAKPAAETASAAAASPAAATAPGPVAKVEAQPGAPAPAAEDGGSLEQYRVALITTARRYKRYPRAAIDNNWEGVVVVRMVIGANGMIATMSVKTSSGHEILDKQAIDMFTKTKPIVPIPPALRGREFAVELRTIFSLKEPDA